MATTKLFAAFPAATREQWQALIKKELQEKLEEFTEQTETIEEVQENKEQIEISRSYEKLPNPAIISMNEFMHDELHYRYKEEESNEA